MKSEQKKRHSFLAGSGSFYDTLSLGRILGKKKGHLDWHLDALKNPEVRPLVNHESAVRL